MPQFQPFELPDNLPRGHFVLPTGQTVIILEEGETQLADDIITALLQEGRMSPQEILFWKWVGKMILIGIFPPSVLLML